MVELPVDLVRQLIEYSVDAVTSPLLFREKWRLRAVSKAVCEFWVDPILLKTLVIDATDRKPLKALIPLFRRKPVEFVRRTVKTIIYINNCSKGMDLTKPCECAEIGPLLSICGGVTTLAIRHLPPEIKIFETKIERLYLTEELERNPGPYFKSLKNITHVRMENSVGWRGTSLFLISSFTTNLTHLALAESAPAWTSQRDAIKRSVDVIFKEFSALQMLVLVIQWPAGAPSELDLQTLRFVSSTSSGDNRKVLLGDPSHRPEDDACPSKNFWERAERYTAKFDLCSVTHLDEKRANRNYV